MNIAIFGYVAETTHICDTIRKYGDAIVCIIMPKNRQIHEELKVYAKNNNIPLLMHTKELIPPYADIGVSNGYSQIISPQLLKMFPKGIINIHGALLPQYRGGNVLNWVLVNGEKETGVTIHYMDEGIDTGDIIAQIKIPIKKTDTAKKLCEKLNENACTLFEKTWESIRKNQIKRIIQDESEAHYWPARKPKDGKIDFKKMDDKQIYNLVRALVHPWPGAYFYKNGKKITINTFTPLSQIKKLR